ncbi:ATP-binding domain-containing protein [Candidatus Dojkabacteria bacterium]|nr:ATP-binding domain-containing protein [Candidatus Dojkabacteria bacterium]
MEIELSMQQQETITKILQWFKSPARKQYITLGGYAGTGKTTLIGFISKQLREGDAQLKVAFCSYTGKAVRIMDRKLQDSKSIFPDDSVSTIHRLIYEPQLNDDGVVIGWRRKSEKEFKYGLIIVDEASMVNQTIWEDLLQCDVPILAIGDHGQLPPIEGRFNLMDDPELRLEEIYRQEKDNPIVFVSKMARTRGIIPTMEYGKGVVKMSRTNPDTQEFLSDLFLSYDDDMLVLVGYNNTRVKLNKAIRGLLGFESEEPQVSDRVICLRNSYDKHLSNGMMGRIKSIETITDDWGKYYKARISLDDREGYDFEGLISYNQFGAKETIHAEKTPEVDLFDFGYALTVHKAQGSQARRVVVFEEKFSSMEHDMWKRWLYTAVTRASEELYIIG